MSYTDGRREKTNMLGTYCTDLADYIREGDLKAVKQFLDENEVDFEYTDGNWNYNPYLILACVYNHYEVAALLIERGAKVNKVLTPDKGEATSKLSTPLNFAISNNNLPLVRLLLEKGADATLSVDMDFFSLGTLDPLRNLRLAIGNNNFAIVEALFEEYFYVEPFHLPTLVKKGEQYGYSTKHLININRELEGLIDIYNALKTKHRS